MIHEFLTWLARGFGAGIGWTVGGWLISSLLGAVRRAPAKV